MSSTTAVVLFVVGIIAAIMLHEWGHFITARRFGMRADRFFLGFGPTLWSTRVGETEYGVKAIPAGGFVRIKGMTPADERLAPVPEAVFGAEALAAARRTEQGGFEGDGHLPGETGPDEQATAVAIPEASWHQLERELARRGTPSQARARIVRRARTNLSGRVTPERAQALLTEVITTEVADSDQVGSVRHRLLAGDAGRFFHDRPPWQRAVVLSAGSAMHFVIAVVLLLAAFLVFPQPTGELTTEASQIVPDSPAAEAGLEEGDRIVAIAGEPIEDFDQIRDDIRARAGQTVSLTIASDGEERTVEVTPQRATDPETGETVGQIGYAPTLVTERLSVGDALYATFVGPTGVPAMVVATFEGLGRVFGPEGIGAIFDQITGGGQRPVDSGASIVGAANLAGQAATSEAGLFLVLGLFVSINVFVGIFNLLPLPPLDGGHLAVLGIERTVNAVRRARGRRPDFHVDPRAVAAVAVPVLVVLGTVFFGLLWLDVTNPIQLPG